MGWKEKRVQKIFAQESRWPFDDCFSVFLFSLLVRSRLLADWLALALAAAAAAAAGVGATELPTFPTSSQHNSRTPTTVAGSRFPTSSQHNVGSTCASIDLPSSESSAHTRLDYRPASTAILIELTLGFSRYVNNLFNWVLSFI
jgi:hypothetical protein